MKEAIQEKTLAQLVTLNPTAAVVFEKYGLDFCCKGKRTLEEACSEDHLKLKTVEHELEKILQMNLSVPEDRHLDKMDLDELIDYIISRHHHYVKESMPMIHSHLQKVVSKHGEKHPELNDILQLFTEVKEEMEQHMYKEENILFPRIKEINTAHKSLSANWIPDKYYISAPIEVMEGEHDKAGNILAEIKKLTANYTAPDNACTTYRLSFNELNDFELNLHQHVHLENNILFPRALEMQQLQRQVLFN
jgi:regulator of cell morphogenesis and NO signaling